MKRIKVNTGRPYEVLTGPGLLKNAGEYISAVTAAKKVAIVTDDTVDALYAGTLAASLAKSGFEVCKFVFPNGEGSKNIATYSNMLEFMAENRLTRSD